MVLKYLNLHLQIVPLSGGDIVSANDYQFDYKTGVLQFDADFFFFSAK